MEDDKRIMEEIRETPVEVPESLSPENITAYLKENGKALRKREETRKVIRLRTFLGAAAAVLVAAIAIPTLIIVGNNKKSTENEMSRMTSSYEAMSNAAEAQDSEVAVATA
ncbi:MAG: hypothetical protein ACSW75_00265, partial [Lachnospiraceae bacterium]